jgi:hypothetical protein
MAAALCGLAALDALLPDCRELERRAALVYEEIEVPLVACSRA